MLRLGYLQREARAKHIPVVIVFEGWDAAGKGTLINRLILALDPRGFSVHATNPPTEDERLRPFLWRFWIKLPARGRIAIFDRSWYGRVMVERVDKITRKAEWRRSYAEINAFERQLADDGCVLIKLYLHISRKEQKKRFRKLQANKATAWKVTREDWKHNKQYEKYQIVVEEMLAKTETEFAPWTIIEAHDSRFATVKLLTTVIEALERRIQAIGHGERKPEEPLPEQETSAAGPASVQVTVTGPTETALRDKLASSILDTVDLSPSLSHEEYQQQLPDSQKRLFELEHRAYLERIPVIIVYEGWDSAGKGGNIRRLVRGMDPRGYQVITIAAPNDVEKSRHYLWRFWMHFPKAGHIAIFDRSWYGRVLVERVEGFCPESDWKRAYREINEMEQQWVEFGAVLVKFWLHIDKDEQLRRFEDRQNTAHKQWKITEEDWRNREKWDRYKEAVDEILLRTSTPLAPWTVVEANSKWYARIKALKTVIRQIEERL